MVGALGEMVGAGAVVASLLYLGHEVRHSRSLASVEGVEALTTKTVDFALTISRDPELADLVMRVQTEGVRRNELDRGERGRLGYLYFSVVLLQAGMFERWRNGLVSNEAFETYSLRAEGLLAAPYFRDVWPYIAPSYAVEFRVWVEQRFGLSAPERLDGTA